MRVWLAVLLLPSVSAQVLFEDVEGDGGLGPDLVDAELVSRDGLYTIEIGYVPGPSADGFLEVSWGATDVFGREAGRFGVLVDLGNEEFWLTKGGEQWYPREGRLEPGSPSKAIIEGIPIGSVGGVAMDSFQGAARWIAGESDSATGTTQIFFEAPLEYGVSVRPGAAIPGAITTAGSASALTQMTNLSASIEAGAVTWTAGFPPLSPDAFDACGQWRGTAYIQDPRPDDREESEYWATLLQLDWGISTVEGAARPVRFLAHVDPRADVTQPNFTVAIDPAGYVQVVTEKDWWRGGSQVSDFRFRFGSYCEVDGVETLAELEYEPPAPRNWMPAPSALAFGLLTLLVARRYAGRHR